MSVRELHEYLAECDECRAKMRFDSFNFKGNAWWLYPTSRGWRYVVNSYVGSKLLCPECAKAVKR